MAEVAERGTIVETKTGRIARHLQSIDPVLVAHADEISGERYKDLSSPVEFDRGLEKLGPSDLVGVLLTDIFPEDGIVRPEEARDPDSLNFATHLTINSVAEPIPFGGADFPARKYAILVPLDGIRKKVTSFHPHETTVMGEFQLPKGSVIVKGKEEEFVEKAGNAKVVDADFSEANAGDRLPGFQRAVYEQMISLGYFPQASSMEGWAGWGGSPQAARVLSKFAAENKLALGNGRYYDQWPGEMEDFAFQLQRLVHQKNPVAFRKAQGWADEFLAREDVPNKYKHAVVELVRRQASALGVDIELAGFSLDEQAEKARKKIVDLTQPTGHFLHQPALELLPIVLKEGIVSHDFARSAMGVDLGKVGPIQERNEILGYKGLNYISVNWARKKPVVEVIKDPETAYAQVVMILISPKLEDTGKVGGVPAHHKDEWMIKTRISPRFFDGLVANQKFLDVPAKDLAEHLLFEGMEMDWKTGGRATSRRTTGLARQRFIEKYVEDLDSSLTSSLKKAQAGLMDSYKKYATASGYNEEADEVKVDRYGNPLYLQHINGAIDPIGTSGKYWRDDPDLRKKPTFLLGVDTPETLEALRVNIDRVERPRIERLGMETGKITIAAYSVNAEPMFGPAEAKSRTAKTEDLVALVESIYDQRKEIMEKHQQIWNKYVESVAGKPLDRATGKDFFSGLAKQSGIPLYDTEGKVIWPKS